MGLCDLPGLDREACRLIENEGMAVNAGEGVKVFEPGRRCELFYVLTKGVIRVQIVAESGREIVLYRIGPGEACVMTVACLMGHGLYNGEGIVEEEVQGFAIGLPLFNRLLASSESFRSHILNAYSHRFTDLVEVLENVAFRPLEERLARRLLELCGPDGEVNCTHQFLATDLGSAREVISRILKRWQQKGAVSLERGRIKILSRSAISQLASPRV